VKGCHSSNHSCGSQEGWLNYKEGKVLLGWPLPSVLWTLTSFSVDISPNGKKTIA
jgi:hypothetical protein